MSAVSISVLLAVLTLLEGVALFLARQAIDDRRKILDAITELTERVGRQNGRVGILETEVENLKDELSRRRR